MTEKKGPIMYKEVSGWKVAQKPERQSIYSPKGRASIARFFKVSAFYSELFDGSFCPQAVTTRNRR